MSGGTGTAARGPRRASATGVLVLACGVVGAVVLGGCTAGDAPPPPAPGRGPAQATPPPPPAACALDVAEMATATGLAWTPEQATATDARCVYDPAGGGAPSTAAPPPGEVVAPPGSDFVAVEITPLVGTDPRAELDGLAALCAEGSTAQLDTPGGGFVCRLGGGSVYAAAVRGADLVTVSASAVPPGTTAARLVVAFGDQLRRVVS